jgi:hypothetical protein
VSHPKVSTAEKRAELEAKGEPWPVCDCHGLEKVWQSDSQLRAGGRWKLRCSERAHNKRAVKKRIARARAAGLCVVCKKHRAIEGQNLCLECVERRAKFRAERRAAGLCVWCGKPVDGGQYCLKHWIDADLSRVRYRYRKQEKHDSVLQSILDARLNPTEEVA